MKCNKVDLGASLVSRVSPGLLGVSTIYLRIQHSVDVLVIRNDFLFLLKVPIYKWLL